MIKRLSILFMMMAIGTFLAHAIIPHHEHGEKICFEMSHCENDGDGEHHDFHPCCLKAHEFIRVQDEHHITKSDSKDGSLCDCHFPPILLFISSFFDFDHDTPVKVNTKPYLNLYTSADVYSANSRRGPPQLL